MLDERPAWHARGACFGMGQAVFYPENDEGEADYTDPAPARAVCQACSIRRHCLDEQLKLEAGAAIINRHGIHAGLTPAQRYSLEKRGNAKCPACGETFDPLAHLDGWLVCDGCDVELQVMPLPNDGDAWQDRHTELARRVMPWLVEHVAVNDVVPTAPELAKVLKVRVGDVVRVYEALVEDGCLEPLDGVLGMPLVRRPCRVIATWQPPHLS